MKIESGRVELDGESIAYEIRNADEKSAMFVMMHGAGQGCMERHAQLADAVAEMGNKVLTFDFSGHGISSGKLEELSLSRRRTQATGIIEQFHERSAKLILISFSMSGQTICDLIAEGVLKIDAVALCCPAAYRPEVFELRFGDSNFTSLLREPESWKSSSSFTALANFDGRCAFIIPTGDTVIPQEITEAFIDSRRGSSAILKLPECPHKIAGWLRENPIYLSKVVNLITDLQK